MKREPFFARSLTLVPRSLLLNRSETLATQAKKNALTPRVQNPPALMTIRTSGLVLVDLRSKCSKRPGTHRDVSKILRRSEDWDLKNKTLSVSAVTPSRTWCSMCVSDMYQFCAVAVHSIPDNSHRRNVRWLTRGTRTLNVLPRMATLGLVTTNVP